MLLLVVGCTPSVGSSSSGDSCEEVKIGKAEIISKEKREHIPLMKGKVELPYTYTIDNTDIPFEPVESVVVSGEKLSTEQIDKIAENLSIKWEQTATRNPANYTWTFKKEGYKYGSPMIFVEISTIQVEVETCDSGVVTTIIEYPSMYVFDLVYSN